MISDLTIDEIRDQGLSRTFEHSVVGQLVYSNIDRLDFANQVEPVAFELWAAEGEEGDRNIYWNWSGAPVDTSVQKQIYVGMRNVDSGAVQWLILGYYDTPNGSTSYDMDKLPSGQTEAIAFVTTKTIADLMLEYKNAQGIFAGAVAKTGSANVTSNLATVLL